MVTYRKAEQNDENGIAEVLKDRYNIESTEEAKHVFREEFARYSYIVVEESGRIIGIACWRMHGLPKHQLAEVGRAAVLKSFSGRGITEELFSRVVQEADKFYKSHNSKLRKIYVYSHSSDSDAHAIYKKIGLIKEAELKDHYYKDEDEFIFSMFMD